MKAILVSVDYHDLLALTLPYNRHHFDEVMVVTSHSDTRTADVALTNNCLLYFTDAFYRGGATFNKWLALEEGLDVLGRHGWLCLMDADILWPKRVKVYDEGEYLVLGQYDGGITVRVGELCSPLRRMLLDTSELLERGIPSEDTWSELPVHRNVGEWAGYTQIFHASDPVLGRPPWHQTNWAHAGGADTFFQQKWDISMKVRPNFEVLHLGPAGQNWMGRATPFLDGTVPEEAGDRSIAVRRMWSQRRGRKGVDKFREEKL